MEDSGATRGYRCLSVLCFINHRSAFPELVRWDYRGRAITLSTLCALERRLAFGVAQLPAPLRVALHLETPSSVVVFGLCIIRCGIARACVACACSLAGKRTSNQLVAVGLVSVGYRAVKI